jgi:uncharacterized protein (TIGR00369 family)
MMASKFGLLLEQLRVETVDADGYELAIQMPVTEEVVNRAGSLQGGLTATLADIVAGRLAVATRPDGRSVNTTSMNLNYLAPLKVGPARASARILRAGGRSTVVEVHVHDLGTDELAAVAIVSFTVRSTRAGVPAAPPAAASGEAEEAAASQPV